MKTILLILLSLKLSSQIDDKTLHVYSGFAITMVTSEVLQGCNVKPWKAVLIGFGAGVLAGAGKELVWDKAMHRGTPDVWDFTSTCWGSLIGVAIEIPIIDLKARRKDKQLNKILTL